jgi:hypothetical protein
MEKDKFEYETAKMEQFSYREENVVTNVGLYVFLTFGIVFICAGLYAILFPSYCGPIKVIDSNVGNFAINRPLFVAIGVASSIYPIYHLLKRRKRK